MVPALGKLEKVDLRTAWLSEASDFTPWLAREENLALLGEAIGVELEFEATEKDVGPFRADILCKDTATGHWVLIENQLGKTDHGHLGQLLTYAAGLQAVTIVWIAAPFTDEHRATLDWLNEITDERFNFFGLEIELWRIGNSDPAPKFNIVSKPNDWTRTIYSAATGRSDGALSELKRLQLEYWTAFRAFMEQHPGKVKPTQPLPQHWMQFALGRMHFYLLAIMNTRDNRIGVYVLLGGPNAKAHFHLLGKEKAAIEAEMKTSLDWRELPEKKQSHIMLMRYNTDPEDKTHWPDQHAWIRDTLEKFHAVFGPRVKNLNASEWEGVSASSGNGLDQPEA